MLRKLVALRDTLTIRARLNLMAAVPVTLVLLVGGLSLLATYRIGVNGPVYNDIIATKELSTDVSPSIETLTGYAGEVRTFATTGNTQKTTPELFNAEVAKLNQIEARFEQRHQYWDRTLKDPATRQALLVDAYKPAKDYFKVVHANLVPAIYTADNDGIRAFLNGPLQDDYNAHIAAIDKVQELATANEQREEQAASRTTVIQVVVTIFVFLFALVIIVLLGLGTSRTINERIFRLQQVAKEELPRMLKEVRRATAAGEPVPAPEPIVFASRDELSDAADAFNDVVGTAVDLAGQQALLQRSTAEMFVNLGRRNHKLLSRTLSYITELERDERNPATLKSLFRLDHLTTRMRRHAESLLVLAGSTPLRTWSRPVAAGDVVRAALSEIEAYERVDVEPLAGAAVRGGAVSDVAHLLAELLENSATFSPPDSRVRVTGRSVGDGYALIIIDEGIGMTADELVGANRRLAAGSSDLDGSRMLGLAVVGRLSARHDIHVELMDSPTGGLVTRVIMPPTLLEQVAVGNSAALDNTPVSVSAGAEGGLPALGRFGGSSGGGSGGGGPARPDSGGGEPKRDEIPAEVPSEEQTEVLAQPAAEAEVTAEDVPADPSAETATEIKNEIKTEATAGTTTQDARTPETPAEETSEDKPVDKPAAFREPAPIERGGRPANNGKSGGQRVPHQAPRRPEGKPVPVQSTPVQPVPVKSPVQPVPVKAVPVQPVPASSAQAASSARPAPPKPEDKPAAEVKAEQVHGLQRRVRGAQLPDTGHDTPTEPAPERSAESVRSALASFAAGRRSAKKHD
jgi:signal transduction histidine kinase